MPGRFLVQTARTDYEILPRGRVGKPGSGLPRSVIDHVCRGARRMLANDLHARAIARSFYQSMERRSVAIDEPGGFMNLASWMEREVRMGRLQIREIKRTRRYEPFVGRHEPPPFEPIETTWIEITLKDDEGLPIEGVRYELILPDDSRRTATFDEDGWTRQERIAVPGTATIRFPDIE